MPGQVAIEYFVYIRETLKVLPRNLEGSLVVLGMIVLNNVL